MQIDRTIKTQKRNLLNYFRNRANETLSEFALQYSAEDFKAKAKAVNHSIIQSKDNLINVLLGKAKAENWTTVDVLECILMITYTNDVVMLETRNSVWEYD